MNKVLKSGKVFGLDQPQEKSILEVTPSQSESSESKSAEETASSEASNEQSTSTPSSSSESKEGTKIINI
jgi:hypothetical protein